MSESIQNISLNFSLSPVWIVLAGVIACSLSVLVYRITIPQIKLPIKSLLIILRTSSLFFLLLLFFNVVLNIFYSIEESPENLVFIDVSTSVTKKDSASNVNKINALIDSLNKQDINLTYYSFGSKLNKREKSEIYNLTFSESSTNFENIFTLLKTPERNIASAVILSDGVINAGKNPLLDAEELNFPVFTVGLGDTNIYRDIAISEIIHNDILYSNEKTTVTVYLSSNLEKEISSFIEFYEDDVLISTQMQNIKSSGMTSLYFEYTPSTVGRKNIRFSVKPFPDEKNILNNTKRSSLNVQSNKINIVMVNGAPSQDVSFIKNAILDNDKFELHDFTISGVDKFVDNQDINIVSKADAFILTGFPSKNTPNSLISKILNRITENNTPILLQINNVTDINRLDVLKEVLGFSIKNKIAGHFLTQPYYDGNPVYTNLFGEGTDWSSLPPINMPGFEIEIRKGTEELLVSGNGKTSKRESPVVTLSNQNGKSISLIGYNFWKWKLQYKDPAFFNNAIQNIINWLVTDSGVKKFRIETNKKLYRLNEEIIFSAQVYDELMEPMNDANISLEIETDGFNANIEMDNQGNGNYKLTFMPDNPGNYTFKSVVSRNLQPIYSETSNFTVEPISAEDLSITADLTYMKNLAFTTKGKFYYIDDTNELFDLLKDNPLNDVSVSRSQKSYEPKNYSGVLIIIIVLFSLEWIIRKRLGMN